MTAFRTVAAVSAALTITLGTVGVSPAHAHDVNRINQGGAVYVEGTGYCTVGYNDPHNRRSLIAAHCGHEGARVRIADRRNGTSSAIVGTFYRSKSYDNRLGNDWAAIQWDDNVTIGPNSISGDPWVRPHQVTPGERVCYFGQSTNRVNTHVTCGTYSGNVGNTFFVDAPLTRPGDSGGPMWVPGRGFVGVVSSVWAANSSSLPGSSNYVVGVLPEDGPAVSDVELLGLYAQNALLPVGGALPAPVADFLRTAFAQFFSFVATLPIAIPGIISYN
ncbi:trypsin-like serine protease [Corynebacterium timonense]|uniref:Trypsin n=1 Tax=Corynebacterium timonense TaxID=441500 RepID=A0A1H1QBM3_9CORY|nr:trypsin-like serine protease [Corynebacterium timonense]SDS20279.1 Trypsin [Corynebacterium timonense]